MREDFLHYLWKYKKFDFTKAETSSGETIELIHPGIHNQQSGPDFFFSRVRIGGQLWAGNVEIHLKSSDWYFHNHEVDSNYDNVILHVVWDDDIEVYRKDNSVIPSLALRDLVDPIMIHKYRSLLDAPKKWINCENDFHSFSDFKMQHWLERIYFERLEEKSRFILGLLKDSENNWEAVLFKLLAKNFGLNVNGDSFFSLANSFEFSVLQKCAGSQERLEALFFGQLGLLDDVVESAYFENLRSEYDFLKHKFHLQNSGIIAPKFFRLRPDNFPSIRLSQLASLYAQNKNLFSNFIKMDNLNAIYNMLQVETSDFWQTHYSFKKSHRKRNKKVSQAFANLIIINSLVPLKFCYTQSQGVNPELEILELMQELAPENNSIVNKFNNLRNGTALNASNSQALIHLKNNYCDFNKCLQCELGAELLHG